MVYRIFVEKKPELAHEANGLYNELKNLVGIENLTSVRVINRYDVENIEEALFDPSRSLTMFRPSFPKPTVSYLPLSRFPVSSIRELTRQLSVFSFRVRASVLPFVRRRCIFSAVILPKMT